MKLSSIALATGLALGSVGQLAMAVPIDISSGSVGFTNNPALSFSDVFTFTLPVNTTLTGVISSVVNGGQDVDFTSITLTGPSGSFSFSLINPDPFEVWTISTPSLLAGAYTLTLVGVNSPAVGTYVGNLAIANVPEPGVYSMLLAGLGAVGFLTLRNRRG